MFTSLKKTGPERKPEKVFQASIFRGKLAVKIGACCHVGGIHLHFTTGGDVTSQLFFAEIYKQPLNITKTSGQS